MGANTKIEWATHSWNAWEGCTKVSPGCKNCYAAARNVRYGGGRNWGPGAPRRRTALANWKLPRRWQRKFEVALTSGMPVRPRVFVNSLADWLDIEVPTQWRHDLLDVVEACPGLEFLLLTKRPHNWRPLIALCAAHGSELASRWLAGEAPKNVHVGCTVEDQIRADERCAHLRSIPAEFRFVSYEPALEAVKWDGWEFVDQLICGGESGHGARPMHPEWARVAREWCERSDVSFFFKQWGEWLPQHQEPTTNSREGARAAGIHEFPDGVKTYRVGKSCAGRLLDGVLHDSMPVPF